MLSNIVRSLRPHQLQRLLELLRSNSESMRHELSTVRQAIENQEQAIREGIEAFGKERSEFSGAIAATLQGTNEDKEFARTRSETAERQQNSLIKSQNRLVIWSGLAFFAAAVAAGAAIYYAHVATQQLCEMRRTNELTEKALGTSGESLKQTLAKMQDQTDATLQLYGEARRQTFQEARAADIARNSLKISQRPWLAVSAEVTKLEWRNIGVMVGLDFKYKISAENFGSLPASKVYLFMDDDLILDPAGKALTAGRTEDPQAAAMSEQESICDAAINSNANRYKKSHAVTIFPHQKYVFEYDGPLPISRREVDWAKQRTVPLYIRGCLIYASPTNRVMRKTGFLYALEHTDHTWGKTPTFRDQLNQIYLVDLSGETKSD